MEGVLDPLHLSEQVRIDLANFRTSAIVDYLAERLGCDEGHAQMIFWLDAGVLGHSELDRRRITIAELNKLPRVR